MNLIERYIFRRAFIHSLGSFLSLVSIVWVVQALQKIDIVKTTATAAWNIIWIALLIMPDLAAGVLPFAILIGSIQVLNALNADSERAVISASGASRMVVIKPVVVLGLLGAAFTLVNSHFIAPVAQSAFRDSLRSINAEAITLFIEPGRFQEMEDGIVLSVGDVQGQTIESLFISDKRDPATDLAYFADEARLVEEASSTYLLLLDGQIHRRDADSGSVSVIQFQTYAIDLATLRPASDDWIRTSERSTFELLNPDPNDDLFQDHPEEYQKELHQRMSDWLYCIAFALWALVVASQPRTNRQGPGQAMTLGLAGGLGAKALGFVAVSQIGNGPFFTLLVYAIPLAAILMDSILLWRNFDIAQLRIFRSAWDCLARIAALMKPHSTAGSSQGGAGR